MGCGIQGPRPIEGCARPSQCRPGKRSHGGTEEQENADGSYSARHLVPISLVGAKARAVSHLLTILKVENAESLVARAKTLVAAAIVGDLLYGGSLTLKVGNQFEFFWFYSSSSTASVVVRITCTAHSKAK